MRALFLLLLLVNLVFFAYAYLARDRGGPGPISQLEVRPEKIKVLKAASTPPPALSPGKAAAQKGVPAACVEWGISGVSTARRR